MTTHELIRFFVLTGLALSFGEFALFLSRAFHADYGWPWRRKYGSNGRWRTDLIVVALMAVIGAVCGLAATAFVLDGWRGHAALITTLMALLLMLAVALRLASRIERVGSYRAAVAQEVAQQSLETKRLADETQRVANETQRVADAAEGLTATTAADVLQTAATKAADVLTTAANAAADVLHTAEEVKKKGNG